MVVGSDGDGRLRPASYALWIPMQAAGKWLTWLVYLRLVRNAIGLDRDVHWFQNLFVLLISMFWQYNSAKAHQEVRTGYTAPDVAHLGSD